MYIPVQISGRFPDSGIHTGSSLPSYTASDRCCGTIASYSSITVTRSYRICTCFPFTLWTLQNDESSEAPVIIYSIVWVVVRIESRLIFYSIAWYKTKRNMFGRALGFVLAAITMMRNKLWNTSEYPFCIILSSIYRQAKQVRWKSPHLPAREKRSIPGY